MGAPPDLRWQLADDDGANPQGSLFEQVVERHIGKGEYRGMEFLHVNARRIINEVPAASRMPFRFTINAYRGCSHACSYCIAGETPILMGDGSTKPLGDVQVGDEIYGTVRSGSYRRYVKTRVLAHWSTVKPAFRVTLQDGTQLVASAEHRFLTDRGWKYVKGGRHGQERRPYLTANNKLMGTGHFSAGPDHGPEYRRGYLCGMFRGDGVDLESLRRAHLYLATLAIVNKELVLAGAVGAGTSAKADVDAIGALVRLPANPPLDWCMGFLGGIFDAEGSYTGGSLRIANTDPELIEQIRSSMRRLGFRHRVETAPRHGMTCVRLLGGLREALRFFHRTDPAITRKRSIEGQAIKNGCALGVASVEPLGLDLRLFDITTGTGDFIANGVVSHNCFARPTHEYLGMNAGDDFERRIVVKVNAVERVRAELAPARWRGEHIAMGTNTDPYQRCEAKYRLTQGIVKELVAARNPFSILTKSTLILRDLDVLAEAAGATDVRANFSIGTLDEEVWRLTEPGTPHPRQRVAALAKLNQAGVPCGVLVAPVLPGLSDRPEQLEAVVAACVEAGATSISPILLHLRPGVREHYLGWLAEARPDLVERYDELYPRSYAPKATQQALSRQVARIVARHGGLSSTPSSTRAVKPRPQAPPPAKARQLALEV